MKRLQIKEYPLALGLGCTLLINGILWIYTLIHFFHAEDLVPLHYTIYYGIDLIDYKTKLFSYPIMGLIVIGVNMALAFFLKEEKLIRYFLLAGSLLTQVVLFASVLALVANYYWQDPTHGIAYCHQNFHSCDDSISSRVAPYSSFGVRSLSL